MSATLYLVRHATPDWSRTDLRYDIPPGPPLTPHGEAEAAKLGAFLKPLDIVHIHASPLERTTRTAQIAAAALSLPVETALDLAEWQHGELEADVLARMRAFVDTALEDSAVRGPIALVTHGGPIRILLADLGLARAELDHYRRIFDHENPVPPAGVWRIRRSLTGEIEKPELVFAPAEFPRYIPSTAQV